MYNVNTILKEVDIVKKNIILVVAFMLLIASVTLVIVLVTNNNSKEVKVNYYSNEAALELESEVLTSSSDFILQM